MDSWVEGNKDGWVGGWTGGRPRGRWRRRRRAAGREAGGGSPSFPESGRLCTLSLSPSPGGQGALGGWHPCGRAWRRRRRLMAWHSTVAEAVRTALSGNSEAWGGRSAPDEPQGQRALVQGGRKFLRGRAHPRQLRRSLRRCGYGIQWSIPRSSARPRSACRQSGHDPSDPGDGGGSKWTACTSSRGLPLSTRTSTGPCVIKRLRWLPSDLLGTAAVGPTVTSRCRDVSRRGPPRPQFAPRCPGRF
jgi:hypothetical protein